MAAPSNDPLINMTSFPSDKNGCGFYRTVIPFGYATTQFNWNVSYLYQFVFDLNLIRACNYVRFQRQCTENQKRCMIEYKRCIDATKSNTKLVYELDDIVHGIEPHNIAAYQFFTPIRRQNVLEIMKMCNIVTFSTKFLKHFYEREFGIKNSTVIQNYLPKFLWNPDQEVDKRPRKSKPVIVWAGSASHVGPGGDLEFLIHLIEKTVDEFEWLFVGCIPPCLMAARDQGKVSFVDWVGFWQYPALMQSIRADIAIAPIRDSLFNYAKSDLKYVEYSAMGIPSICSSIGNGIGPYNQTNANLVENKVDAWYSAIKNLLSDENKYYDTINKQFDFVNKRWLEDNMADYKRVFV